MPRIMTAMRAPVRANGTAIITARGNAHVSNCAAKIRNTIIIAKPNAKSAAEPVRFS